MQLGEKLIWTDVLGSVHSAPWAVIAVGAAGGLVMGLCVKYFGTNDGGIGFDAVLVAVKQDGELGLKQLKRVVINTYAGLVTGASIGPESPLITIAGFMGDWIARRLKTSRQQLMAFITIALRGGLGVLVDSPVAGPILFSEQPPTADKATNTLLVFTSMIAAAIGFGVYYFKGLAVGLIIGVCAAISPLVRFDGSAQLGDLVAHASQCSAPALIGLALLRLLSTSVALGGGY